MSKNIRKEIKALEKEKQKIQKEICKLLKEIEKCRITVSDRYLSSSKIRKLELEIAKLKTREKMIEEKEFEMYNTLVKIEDEFASIESEYDKIMESEFAASAF